MPQAAILPPGGKNRIRGNFYHWLMGNERAVLWVACEDEWESNGPVVAFTSEALAHEHCAALNAEGSGRYNIMPLPLLDAAAQKVTWHHRQVKIHADGTFQRYEQKPRVGWHYEYDDPALLICEPRGATVVNAYATSAEAALAACDAAVEAELAKRR